MIVIPFIFPLCLPQALLFALGELPWKNNYLSLKSRTGLPAYFTNQETHYPFQNGFVALLPADNCLSMMVEFHIPLYSTKGMIRKKFGNNAPSFNENLPQTEEKHHPDTH